MTQPLIVFVARNFSLTFARCTFIHSYNKQCQLSSDQLTFLRGIVNLVISTCVDYTVHVQVVCIINTVLGPEQLIGLVD